MFFRSRANLLALVVGLYFALMLCLAIRYPDHTRLLVPLLLVGTGGMIAVGVWLGDTEEKRLEQEMMERLSNGAAFVCASFVKGRWNGTTLSVTTELWCLSLVPKRMASLVGPIHARVYIDGNGTHDVCAAPEVTAVEVPGLVCPKHLELVGHPERLDIPKGSCVSCEIQFLDIHIEGVGGGNNIMDAKGYVLAI